MRSSQNALPAGSNIPRCLPPTGPGVGSPKVTARTPAERAELVAVLGKLTGEKVEARFVTDAALIGGAVVRIGSTIYDGSIRTQLERMRARMISE